MLTLALIHKEGNVIIISYNFHTIDTHPNSEYWWSFFNLD